MTITYNNLFSQIYDFENLYNAYLKARRGKRDRREVLKFELNLEENLIQLQNEMEQQMKSAGSPNPSRKIESKRFLP